MSVYSAIPPSISDVIINNTYNTICKQEYTLRQLVNSSVVLFVHQKVNKAKKNINTFYSVDIFFM